MDKKEKKEREKKQNKTKTKKEKKEEEKKNQKGKGILLGLCFSLPLRMLNAGKFLCNARKTNGIANSPTTQAMITTTKTSKPCSHRQ